MFSTWAGFTKRRFCCIFENVLRTGISNIWTNINTTLHRVFKVFAEGWRQVFFFFECICVLWHLNCTFFSFGVITKTYGVFISCFPKAITKIALGLWFPKKNNPGLWLYLLKKISQPFFFFFAIVISALFRFQRKKIGSQEITG